MSFLNNLKEDLSQAVNELVPEDELLGADEYVDNLDDELLELDDIKKDSTDKEKKEHLLSDTGDIDFDAILKSADESVVNTLGDELSSTLEASVASNMTEERKKQTVEDLTQEPEEIINDSAIDELNEFSNFSVGSSASDDLSDLIREFESQIMTDEAEAEKKNKLSNNLDMENPKDSVIKNQEESKNIEENLQDDFDSELKLEKDSEPVLEIFESELSDEETESAEMKEISEHISMDVDNEVTVIAKGTRIDGNITSDNSLEIMGTVIGDIECLGKLSVTGHVEGNFKASEIFISRTRIQGNLVTKGVVKLGTGAVLLGNIEAASAVIAGDVKGEIDVNGPIVVDSTAVVKGNIKAKSVQVNNGAVIDGYCSLVYADVDIDNFFDGENEKE